MMKKASKAAVQPRRVSQDIKRDQNAPLLSPQEVSKALKGLGEDKSRDGIERIRAALRDGRATADDVHLLLAWFCDAVREIRECMHSDSLTPDLVELVAERFRIYLDDQADPKKPKKADLMLAFGIRKAGRGRKPETRARERELIAAALIESHMSAGNTLETAQAKVAKELSLSEEHVRDSYSKWTGTSELKMRLLYAHLFSALGPRAENS